MLGVAFFWTQMIEPHYSTGRATIYSLERQIIPPTHKKKLFLLEAALQELYHKHKTNKMEQNQ